MLGFSGLLTEVIEAGSGGIASSNPGLVKVFGGFVFPIGLVMYVSIILSSSYALLRFIWGSGSCFRVTN